MSRFSLVLLAACGGAAAPSPTAPPPVASRPPSPVEPKPVPPPPVTPSDEVGRYIKMLDDPQLAERALRELEQLGDPSAIESIGKYWVGGDRSVHVFQVLIGLARPLTAEEARAKFITAYERVGRPASWDAALPYLRKALAELDEANPRSVDTATKAAEAIGEARLATALPELAAVATTPPAKKLVSAQVAAIRALGRLDGDKPRAIAALGRVTQQELPPLRTGKSTEELFGLKLAVIGAAVNALGELADPRATPLLVPLPYRVPQLMMQIRRAVVASGRGAVDEYRKVLRGEHAAVEALVRTRQLDRYCGDKAERPADQCERVAARDYYAAIILGDLRDPRAVPELLKVLERTPLPAYYLDDQAGPIQHAAVFDALHKLGAPEPAPALRALWSKPATDVVTRSLAIGAYAFAARDAAGVDALGAIMADNSADDGLRQSAALAYGRLAREAKNIKPLLDLAKRYLDASAKQQQAAARKLPAKTAADAELDKAKRTHDRVKAALLDLASNPKSTTAQIKTATAEAQRAEDVYKDAKKQHRDKIGEWKNLDSAAKAYLGYARMFQTHAASVELAIRCADDVRCYAATLRETPSEAARHLKPHIADAERWSDDDKRGLVTAHVDRAMLELGKRATKDQAALRALLLDAVTTDLRGIREPILLALPKLAPRPCSECVTRLDAVIAADQNKAELASLRIETEIIRNYFAAP